MIEFILQDLGTALLLLAILWPIWWKSNRPLSKNKKPMAVRNK